MHHMALPHEHSCDPDYSSTQLLPSVQRFMLSSLQRSGAYILDLAGWPVSWSLFAGQPRELCQVQQAGVRSQAVPSANITGCRVSIGSCKPAFGVVGTLAS